MNTMRARQILTSATAVMLFAAAIAAQSAAVGPRGPAGPAAPPAPPPPPADFGFAAIAQAPAFEFIASAPAFLERTVTGAPYSADSVSETTRVLADGTRIKNENTSKIARDSEGRVRKEQSFEHIGFWVPKGGRSSTQITITDPVAKKTIILNPADKSARVMALPSMPRMPTPPTPPAPPVPGTLPAPPAPPTPPAGASGQARIEHRVERRVTISRDGGSAVAYGEAEGVNLRSRATDGEVETDILTVSAGAGPMEFPRQAMFHSVFDPQNVVTEQLGERVIQGIKTTGTRRTTTIPTGAIGNDRPIVSVLEQWTSPELGVVVLRTLRDPQIGETVYRLENIDRSEPLKSLFEVPADYEVKEMQPRMQRMELRKRSDG